MTDVLRDSIYNFLAGYRLSNWEDEDGNSGYPLAAALSNGAGTIAPGLGDIEDIADALAAHLSHPQPIAEGEAVAWTDTMELQRAKTDHSGTFWVIKPDPARDDTFPDYELVPLYATPTIPAGHRVVPDALHGILDEIDKHASYSRDRFAISTQARVSCNDILALVAKGKMMIAASPSAGGV